jgi:hypothetical protein
MKCCKSLKYSMILNLYIPVFLWLAKKFSVQRVPGSIPTVITNLGNKKLLKEYFTLLASSHLKMGIEETPEIFVYRIHIRQWEMSNITAV